MPGKSIRVFAGPNGSGKSTLFEEIKNKEYFNIGFFINADEIESQLKKTSFIDLTDFGIKTTQSELENFLKSPSAISLLEKAKKFGNEINIEIINNLIVDKAKDTLSYEASLIAAFIRHLLFNQNKSFAFETVMSHASKIDELEIAKNKGYKIYLYFICTDDPQINISRVENRVVKGGHNVAAINIKKRYKKTLENLAPAMKVARRAYLFDNSEKGRFKLIAETFNNRLKLNVDSPPKWFIDFVLPNFE